MVMFYSFLMFFVCLPEGILIISPSFHHLDPSVRQDAAAVHAQLSGVQAQCIFPYFFTVDTLWWTNIAMENGYL